MDKSEETGKGKPANGPRSRLFVAGVGAAFLILAFGFIVAYVMTGPADRRPTSVETFAATSLRRVFVPLHAQQVPRPPSVTTSALVDGRKVFRQRCALCHGGSGRGDAALATTFYPPVPDLTGSAMEHWSDRDLFWTVQNGIRMTAMPAWRSSLNDQQTWDVVAYIRHMSEQNGKNYAGSRQDGTSDASLRKIALQTIEDEGCQDCHMIDGVGARIGPNLSEEWARGRSDTWLIGHFRNPSKYTPGTPMPAFDHLSDLQLKALVRYLQDSNQ